MDGELGMRNINRYGRRTTSQHRRVETEPAVRTIGTLIPEINMNAACLTLLGLRYLAPGSATVTTFAAVRPAICRAARSQNGMHCHHMKKAVVVRHHHYHRIQVFGRSCMSATSHVENKFVDGMRSNTGTLS
jgi:hypothetical protein